jgi:hypothetical protein
VPFEVADEPNQGYDMLVDMSSDKAQSSIDRLQAAADRVVEYIDAALLANEDGALGESDVAEMVAHRQIAQTVRSKLNSVRSALNLSMNGKVDMSAETLAMIEDLGVIATLYGSPVEQHRPNAKRSSARIH